MDLFMINIAYITCGLLWCFSQLFGLSFWRHPFTAEDPLMSNWCNVTFLQIYSKCITHFHFCVNCSVQTPSEQSDVMLAFHFVSFSFLSYIFSSHFLFSDIYFSTMKHSNLAYIRFKDSTIQVLHFMHCLLIKPTTLLLASCCSRNGSTEFQCHVSALRSSKYS